MDMRAAIAREITEFVPEPGAAWRTQPGCQALLVLAGTPGVPFKGESEGLSSN